MKNSELYLTLSLELGWFSPQEAQQVIKDALHQKLLKQKDELVSPTFDINKITIPVGFYPSKKDIILERKEEKTKTSSFMESITKRITDHTQQTPSELSQKIQQIATTKRILPEIAALYLAYTHKIPVEDILERAYRALFKESE